MTRTYARTSVCLCYALAASIAAAVAMSMTGPAHAADWYVWDYGGDATCKLSSGTPTDAAAALRARGDRPRIIHRDGATIVTFKDDEGDTVPVILAPSQADCQRIADHAMRTGIIPGEALK
jgi:hypothetical protein